MKTMKTFLVLMAFGVSVTMMVGCRSAAPVETVEIMSGPVEVTGKSAVAEHLRQREPEARAERVNAYFATHSSSETLRARLMAGGVFTGMTTEQLRVVLGDPWLMGAPDGAAEHQAVWMYLSNIDRQDRFLFQNGVLTGWKLGTRG